MSKQQTIKTIRTELERLNQEIDLRIIRGVSYSRQARRHRFLKSQLARLVPARTAWFGKSLSFIFS